MTGSAGTSLGTESLIPDPADDDAVLVARAKDDPPAFAPLYHRYVEPVHRYCYHRLGTWEAAEDATSQVFAKALIALPSCHGGSFRSWLFAIAHNVIADSFRRERPEEQLTETDDILDTAPTPEDLAIAAEERRSLRGLLERLPIDQRRVLELRLAGLTGPETAKVLGRTHTAVRLLQYRAVARLRELLAVGADREEAPGRHG